MCLLIKDEICHTNYPALFNLICCVLLHKKARLGNNKILSPDAGDNRYFNDWVGAIFKKIKMFSTSGYAFVIRLKYIFLCCPTSNGSATSEDLFWKLDALQTFIRDLHWPEEEFGKHLEQRLKLMASDMIESCVKR